MQDILALDRAMTLWINQHHHPALDLLMQAVSHLGDAGIAWLVVAVLLLVFGGRRERIIALIFFVGLIFTEFALMPVLRDAWHRPRPFVYMEQLRTLGPKWNRPSFPSAHAHLWAQATLLFAVAYRRFRWLLIVLLVLSLYSRPYVGNHHVIDVLAGAALGGIVGLAELAVASKLGVLRPPEEPPREDDTDTVPDTSG